MPHHTTRHSSEVKTCSKCGETKPLSEYYRHRLMPDGLQVWCKACKAEHHRSWRKANPEKQAKRVRAWREANRERKAETDRAWEKANPEKRAAKDARKRAKHPERYAAQQAVSLAVRRDDFPPASALVCDHCQEAQADHWHHHRGYAPEHKLDVIPVCVTCHTELHRVTP